MTSVWKRLQRVNKHAAKFQLVASYRELTIAGSKKWQPHKVSVIWTRRGRRVASQPRSWEPTIRDPYRGRVVWPVPENVEVTVTLFRDARSTTFEDKDWSFVVEDISPLGKRRHVAVGIVNVSEFARAEEPSQMELVVKMKPLSPKCLEAHLALTLSCSLIREGKATDEDMQSIASLLSAAPLAAPDVGNLDDFEEDAETSLQLARLAAHCSELLQEEEEAEPGAEEEERKKATKRQRSPPIAVEEEEEEMPPEPPEDPESKSRRTADAEQEPTEDLLTWCQRVTAGYGGLKVTNLTTSWRNGMAFCALLHSFHPQLVDMDSLSPHDIAGNCKKAFDAASQLGVPRLLDPADMVLLTVPDKLVVATYLHQLRSHLTGRHAMQCPAPPPVAPPAAPTLAETGPNDRPESPVLERPASPAKPAETLVRPKRADEPPLTVPAAPLMTRQQLMNPFDSDEEDSSNTKSRGEAVSEARPRSESRDEPPKRSLRATQSEGPVTRVIDLSPTREGGLPREANSLPDGFPSALVDPKKRPVSRLAELQERARKLLEEARKPAAAYDPTSPGSRGAKESPPKETEEERRHQEQLRERARRMIAQARQGAAAGHRVSSHDSLNNNNNENNAGCRRLAADGGLRPSAGEEDGDIQPSRTNEGEARRRQTYVELELEALERERQRVDAQAERFEPYLRRVMKSGNQAEEDRCMQRWFALVNEKNALIRRQMQLNLLEKEQDLERRCEMLNRELRDALQLQDWQKTDAQRDREALLLDELVALVDKRDELVQHLDSQEKAIEEDEMMALATRRQRLQPAQERPNCRLQ
ncbi:EH domain-binding protein 1 isoform X2 [Ixodes scapularis]|uniref:EH domain-binding protein 1 isoform X2 n=1 Tax=Ixodes scapularis TaxID=6945 RepID=UPI001A9F099D|nr:EH domain-binding protein 1 isoform X2 [Ixodes scapularis]